MGLLALPVLASAIALTPPPSAPPSPSTSPPMSPSPNDSAFVLSAATPREGGVAAAPFGPVLAGPDDLPADGQAAAPAPGARQAYGLSTFGRDVGAARWEMGGIAAIVIVPRIYRRAKASGPFSFHSEGWFGRDTYELGVDKTLHAWKAYVITDVIQSVISRRTGDDRGAAITAGLFSFGLTTLAEINDGFSKTTGFSYEDEVSQVAGIGLSLLRNLVPGLRDKIDYRLEIKPKFNGALSDTRGRATNSKYLLALQLAGFSRFERSPLRFVEFHVGYLAHGFSAPERLRGDPLRRHVFVGIGFNVQQLFSRQPHSVPERLAKGALDYIQIPYTAVNF